MYHRYTKLFATSALALAILIAPAATFAASSSAPPPTISGVSAPTVLKPGQVGTWTIKASDPRNSQLTYSVNWGDSGSANTPAAEAFTQSANFAHTYANPGTYTVQFAVKDARGLITNSSVTVHVVGSATSSISISNVNSSAIKQASALITWMTNIPGSSTVFYSTTNPATSSSLSSTEAVGVVSHNITLNSLTPDTTYYYYVQSKDLQGDKAQSDQFSFTTAAGSGNNTPTIASFNGPNNLAVGTVGTWTVEASDPNNSQLSYSIDWGDSGSNNVAAEAQVFTQTTTFTHTYAQAGTYTITVTAQNSRGLTATANATVDVTSGSSTGAPTISGMSADVVKRHIVFTWTTNVPADSEVYFGPSSSGTNDVANAAAANTSGLSTSHSVDVTGLNPGETYNFVIKSKNGDGTSATPQFTLTTMTM